MITILVRTQFEGFHRWPGASEDTKEEYLRSVHRHMFHVEVEIEVTSEDRQVEFIEFKRRLNEYCTRWNVPTTNSCETMARFIALWIIDLNLPPVRVLVTEDNENGACWYPDENYD